MRNVKNAALYEMPKIASLNIHTSIRSESSKCKLGCSRHVKSFNKLKIALLKIHTSKRSESSKLMLGRIRQQKSVTLSIKSIDSRISDLRIVKVFKFSMTEKLLRVSCRCTGLKQ